MYISDYNLFVWMLLWSIALKHTGLDNFVNHYTVNSTVHKLTNGIAPVLMCINMTTVLQLKYKDIGVIMYK